MKNRITELFRHKQQDILSVFLTAGYPDLNDTLPLIELLAAAGVDMIEIGIPFSDPVADGPTIQASNQHALNNGITLEKIFAQLQKVRDNVDIPLLMMGYLNPVMQYGMERFCKDAAAIGIDGFILPDLPMEEYLEEYQPMFRTYNLSNIFLITPQTSEQRIRKIDQETEGFIYVVSMDSTTGNTGGFGEVQHAYFQRIAAMSLKNPTMVGFGISDNRTFREATRKNQGAIIGSAFIKALKGNGSLEEKVNTFVRSIRSGNEQPQTH